MRIEPELSQVSLVRVGNFNPTIFQPSWLVRHQLISGGAAADAADIAVIHPDVTAFAIENLFTLQVERERFSIHRSVAPYVLICDLVSRIFGDLLFHTPISKLGINFITRFDAGSQSIRDKIGELLAPRESWGDWGKLVSSGEGAKHGGLQSLTMIQKNVSDRPAGWVLARVEPSVLLKGGQTGISMEVNDHYELLESEHDASAIVAILQEKFDSSIRNSCEIVDQIMSLARE
jgi:hypothetical protein